MQLSKKKMPNLTQFTQKKKKNVFLKMVLETVVLKILLNFVLQTNTRE